MTTTQTISRDDVVAFIEQIESDIEQGWEAQVFELKLAKHVLAAMDSEPVAFIIQDKYERELGVEGHLSRSHVSKYVSQEDINEHEITCMPLYRHAQPIVPVAVPDELAGKSFEYIANKFQVSISEAQWILVGWNACRAAMQAEPVTAATVPDDFICMLTGRAKYLREKGEVKSPELLERAAAALKGENSNPHEIPNGWKLVPIDPTKDMLRAGQSVVGFWLNTVHCYSKMLAAAPAAPEQQNRQQNIPENILASLIDAVNRLLDNDGSRGCFDLIECNAAHREIERLLTAAPEQEV